MLPTHSAVLEDEKPWRVSLPTCRVGCWKANSALIAAALFFTGFPQLPGGGGGRKKETWCNSCTSERHNSRHFRFESYYSRIFFFFSLNYTHHFYWKLFWNHSEFRPFSTVLSYISANNKAQTVKEEKVQSEMKHTTKQKTNKHTINTKEIVPAKSINYQFWLRLYQLFQFKSYFSTDWLKCCICEV